MFNRSRIVLGLAAALSVGLAASQLKAGFGFENRPAGFIKGTVSFSTRGTGGVKIHVYDTDGNLVAELESQQRRVPRRTGARHVQGRGDRHILRGSTSKSR